MPNNQAVIIGGLLVGGVLIYSAISDSPVFKVLTGGANPIDYSDSRGGYTPGDTPDADLNQGAGGTMSAMLAKADSINAADLPYVWGGGHESAGTPSGGGYDCSGCVAAVLSAGGFVSGSVGNDSSLIAELKSKGVIAPGAGRGTPEVTLYDNPGDHIFMSLNGQYFGTSDGDGGPNNTTKFGKGGGGGTWLTSGSDVPVFSKYHILPQLLAPAAQNSVNLTTGDNPRGVAIDTSTHSRHM